MVKLAQKRAMAGSLGKWKEFLKVHDLKVGASLGDPSRRSANDLAAFLKTFEQDSDVKVHLGSIYSSYFFLVTTEVVDPLLPGVMNRTLSLGVAVLQESFAVLFQPP